MFSLSETGSSDQDLNLCGVTMAHAFPILGYLEIDGNKMYMIRDPRGINSKVNYNRAWREDDPNWTDSMLSQIPYSLDNKDGVFYVSPEDMIDCFYLID